jgi:hypothetical protein
MAVVAFFAVMASAVNRLSSVSISLTQETPPLISVVISNRIRNIQKEV